MAKSNMEQIAEQVVITTPTLKQELMNLQRQADLTLCKAYNFPVYTWVVEPTARALRQMFEANQIQITEKDDFDGSIFEIPKLPFWENDKLPEVAYAVNYIEVEFGQRDEGHSLYLDLETCIKETKERRKTGRYEGGGGYYGPEDPISYVEVPFSCLEKEYQEPLLKNGRAHTENHWSPKFRGKTHLIE